MKVLLLVIGKTDSGYISEGIEDYQKRLRKYLQYELKVIPDIKNTKNMSEGVQKEKEGNLILDSIESQDYVILLDENGKEYSSKEFSDFMAQKMLTNIKRMIFVIGGPYGFSNEVYSRANIKISLSRMTFNHQMVRMIFTEQLYRGMTILRGEPYHHE